MSRAFARQDLPGGSNVDFPATVLVERDETEWQAETEGGRIRPPVREFDRHKIARLLDHIGDLKEQPALVVLDIDVTPATDPSAQRDLRTALLSWANAPARPMLVLMRTDDCGTPPIGVNEAVAIKYWKPTPFDDVVGTGSPSKGRILWACGRIAPDADHVDRDFYPFNCAALAAPNGSSDKTVIAIPSVGLIARWLLRQPARERTDLTTASRFSYTYAPVLTSACSGIWPAEPVLQRPSPALFFGQPHTSDDRFIRAPTAAFLQSNPKSIHGWGNSLLIIGQSDHRSGDLHPTDVGPRTPGLDLLAAHIRTFVRERSASPPSWRFLATFSFVLSALSGLIYWLFTKVRSGIMERLELHPLWRRIVHFFFGPGKISIICAAIMTALSANFFSQFVATQAWRDAAYCLIGALISIDLVDTIESEPHVRKGRSPQ